MMDLYDPSVRSRQCESNKTSINPHLTVPERGNRVPSQMVEEVQLQLQGGVGFL